MRASSSGMRVGVAPEPARNRIRAEGVLVWRRGVAPGIAQIQASPPGFQMRPQIQSLLDDVAAVRARWTRLSAATPDDRWATRARPEGWSVAECIAHLNLTARAMQPLLEAAAEKARARGPFTGTMKRSILGAVLAAMIGPVLRIGKTRLGRIKTPPPFVPMGNESRAAISAEFERHLAAHEEALRAADGLPLHQVRVESPFAPGARYDAYSGWMIVVRHCHRHLDQAERVWSR